MERTFLMIKPDGVGRGLVGEVVSRFERKGLRIASMRLRSFSKEEAAVFYAEHEGKGFYSSLIELLVSGPCLGMILEGHNVVRLVRTLIGATDPQEALPGTIRGDYGSELPANIVHASDSPASYEREAELFFQDCPGHN